MDPDRDTSRVVAAITRWIGALAIVATALSFAVFGAAIGLGALAGGALAIGVWALAAAIGRRVAGTEGRARIGWAFAFVIESALVLAVAAVLLWATDPTGMAIGFSALVAGAIAGAIESGARQRAQSA